MPLPNFHGYFRASASLARGPHCIDGVLQEWYETVGRGLCNFQSWTTGSIPPCLSMMAASSQILRTTVNPALSGPRGNKDQVVCASRTQLLLLEAVLAGGACRMFTRMQADCALHGGTCGYLYPGRMDFWLKILEDLGTSPLTTGLLSEAMRQRADNGEFSHISTETTIMIKQRIRGQCDYQASASSKASQAPPQEIVKRRRASSAAPICRAPRTERQRF